MNNDTELSSIILHHHLGLGDHFICCGLVNTISEQYEKIYLACKERNYETLKCLYSENSKIEFLKMLNESSIDYENIQIDNYSKKLNIPVKKIGFVPMKQTDYFLTFYSQASVDFSKRYSNFNFPKNVDGSKELYESVVGDIKDYILVHDSSSEQSKYNFDLFGWRDGKNSNLPVIRITGGITENLLQWVDVIRNAKEIHVSPSSVFFLVDSIAQTLKSDLYYHNIRPGAESFPANTKYNDYRWNIVEY